MKIIFTLLLLLQFFFTSEIYTQDYYTLNIGNRWDYKTVYWDYYSGLDSSYHTVEVIGDTVLPNGQNYYVLSTYDLIWGPFVRIDENHIYYYKIYENEEDSIINLSAELNVPYYAESEIAWTVELIEIDTVDLFDVSTRILRYKLDGLVLRYVNISDKFGLYHLDSPGEPPGTGQWSINLYYSIIDGEEYGEPVSVEDEIIIQSLEFSLSQNYPNPFNPTTKIKFTIPTSPLNPSPYQGEGNRERLVTLIVYDVLGNEIATLVNEEKPAGSYEVDWDGSEFTSGIYFYRLKAGDYIEVKKMVFLR
jgi:hypothetical protein